MIAIRSGNDTNKDKEKYAAAGADETLPKTLNAEQLGAAMARLAKVAAARSAVEKEPT